MLAYEIPRDSGLPEGGRAQTRTTQVTTHVWATVIPFGPSFVLKKYLNICVFKGTGKCMSNMHLVLLALADGWPATALFSQVDHFVGNAELLAPYRLHSCPRSNLSIKSCLLKPGPSKIPQFLILLLISVDKRIECWTFCYESVYNGRFKRILCQNMKRAHTVKKCQISSRLCCVDYNGLILDLINTSQCLTPPEPQFSGHTRGVWGQCVECKERLEKPGAS